MGSGRAQIFDNEECRKILPEAMSFYHDEYHAIENNQRKYYVQSLRYFRALDLAYQGKDLVEIAKEYEVTKSTLVHQLKKTQGKVLIYIRLKKLGRI